MITLSLFPPAWFWIMNPLVKAHHENVEMVKKLQQDDAEQPFFKGKALLEAEKSAHFKIILFQLSVFAIARQVIQKLQV